MLHPLDGNDKLIRSRVSQKFKNSKIKKTWTFIRLLKEVGALHEAGTLKVQLGTDGETRTRTVLLPGDFESPASTNSATSAHL